MASLKKLLHRPPPACFINSFKSICIARLNEPNHAVCVLSSPHLHTCQTWLQTRSIRSRDKGKLKVIAKSSMIMQDGSCMEELPLLIRRVTRDSYPFTTHSYSGDNIRDSEESEFESGFRAALEECTSVSAVFNLLEVPPDRVRGASAAAALNRLHTLKHLNQDWQSIHSFIRWAVMRELYETVQDDVTRLNTSTLVSLVDCYLAAEGFSQDCITAINQELQVRLAEGRLCVAEVLALAGVLGSVRVEAPPPAKPSTLQAVQPRSKFLSDSVREAGETAKYFDRFSAKAEENKYTTKKKATQLLDDVWIHMRSRVNDLDVATLPLTLTLLPGRERDLVTLLERPLAELWPALTPAGVEETLHALLRLKTGPPGLLTSLGRWGWVNLHLVTPDLLAGLLHTALHFRHSDVNLLRLAQRCLQRGWEQASGDLVALCVEYARSNRKLSPRLMEAAAAHFTQYHADYTPLQAFAVLRAFGQLNFLPEESPGFLRAVESRLSDLFPDMEPQHLLEVLASLTMVGVMPHTFLARINSDFFYHKVSNLPSPYKTSALMWAKVLRHAMRLAPPLNNPERWRRWLMARNPKYSAFCYLDRQKVAIWNLQRSLRSLVGPNCLHVLPFYSCLAFYLDSAGLPLPLGPDCEPEGAVASRVAIILTSADHVSVGPAGEAPRLMGAQAQRRDQLARLQYSLVELPAGKFLTNRKQAEAKYLRRILKRKTGLVPLTPDLSAALLPSQEEDQGSQDAASDSDDEAVGSLNIPHQGHDPDLKPPTLRK